MSCMFQYMFLLWTTIVNCLVCSDTCFPCGQLLYIVLCSNTCFPSRQLLYILQYICFPFGRLLLAEKGTFIHTINKYKRKNKRKVKEKEKNRRLTNRTVASYVNLKPIKLLILTLVKAV